MLKITDIISSSTLTKEEKDVLLKELAGELLEKQKSNDYDSSYDKYNDEQKPIVKKSREQAKELKERVSKINENSAKKEQERKRDEEIERQVEELAFLKNARGDNQFSKEYLAQLSGFEIENIYADCMETMPDAMAKAKEDLLKAKKEGKVIFEKDEPKKENAIVIPEKDKPEVMAKEPIVEKEEDMPVSDTAAPKKKESLNIGEYQKPPLIDLDEAYGIGKDTPQPEQDRVEMNEEEVFTQGNNFRDDDGKGRQNVKSITSASSNLKDKIKEHPIKAVAAAAAGCYVLAVVGPVALKLLPIAFATLALPITHPFLAVGGAIAGYAAYEISKGRSGK